MMKIFSVMLLVVNTVSVALADEGAIQCDRIDTQGKQSLRIPIDLLKDYQTSFEATGLPEVKFLVSYSSVLKTVDSSVQDENLGVSAMATEWANDTSVGAHSAVKLVTQKGTFILSCSIH